MIRTRNIATCILLTIFTCGLYGLYWLVCLADDINTISEDRNGTSGGMVLLFSILTCGIYGLYWLYKSGSSLEDAKMRMSLESGEKEHLGLLYLILSVLGLGIVAYALMQSELNKFADLELQKTVVQ